MGSIQLSLEDVDATDAGEQYSGCSSAPKELAVVDYQVLHQTMMVSATWTVWNRLCIRYRPTSERHLEPRNLDLPDQSHHLSRRSAVEDVPE
jgi:hypothetical protein